MSALPYCAQCGKRWCVVTSGMIPACGCNFEPQGAAFERQRRLDEFARAALPSILSADLCPGTEPWNVDNPDHASEIARQSFIVAEAMLAESERRAAPAEGRS